ncbi:hypothetical protein Tsubulata_014020 [Turnera subulata]|uniref:NAD-dependent epimerase/dehydratase domain-containing protein n=1 Tax=Turnera subulata TaxID=218843 RepID=A0A9Q0G5Y1_9ROSI|nr:hypothetical protein Tsubulata_014020 [Turnera subulata]
MEDSHGLVEEINGRRASTPTYCVTGANGYIGSWLVKVLLERGYMVHATVRDPDKMRPQFSAKLLHLISLWGGGERLRLFKADLQEEGSFDEAVEGCDGVFHVAASMEFTAAENENIENYVQLKIIDPAIKGTLNILKSCTKSKSVKKVVFTSSISTLTAKDSIGKWRKVTDETCQNSVSHVWKTKASGWVYVLSKILSEEAAFQYANDNDIDLISVITTTVAGPFLTSSVPSSVQVLLSPITGDAKFFSILSAVNTRMGSIALVHIEDICDAHIFLMEHTKATLGRYICCANSCLLSQLAKFLAKEYPCSNLQSFAEEENGSIPSEISSKKLSELGFKYKHDIKQIIRDAVCCAVDYGFLQSIKK